jgi:8-oxo-dGTP pyrophosphatase MutT (NUDIX family)
VERATDIDQGASAADRSTSTDRADLPLAAETSLQPGEEHQDQGLLLPSTDLARPDALHVPGAGSAFADAVLPRVGRRPRQQIPTPPGTRPGPQAPWADLPSSVRRARVDDIREVFGALGPPVPSPREQLGTGMPAAAVLAAIYEQRDAAWVVLTRRTMHLRAHKGEVSFPGGRAEPGESPVETALREAREEIALTARPEIVGELDHLSTITSGSFIVPYVGILDAVPVGLQPNPAEVDAILPVRLDDLLDPSVYREEIWTMPDGTEHPIVFFDLDEDILWGATAAMLRQLLGFVTGTVGRGQLGHI